VSNVIDLASRRPAPDDPHGSGDARCLACGYEWVQVAPVGDFSFDCPKCHATCGVWAAPFKLPGTEYAVFSCRCGCQHFALALHQGGDWHLLCRKCGRFHEPGGILDGTRSP
jgi:hypothetical protein